MKDSLLGDGSLLAGFGVGEQGLDALAEVLREISPQAGLTHIVVLRGQEHSEAELAQRLGVCGLALEFVDRTREIQRGRVYIVCNGFSPRLVGSILEIKDPAQSDPRQLFDGFFRSLAETMGAKSVAVLLAPGDSRDGVEGLRAVSLQQGLTLVEHECGASSVEGLEAVIEVASLALLPAEIADHLENYSTVQAQEDPFLGKDGELQAVFSMLQNHTGVDFESYKRSTVRRRLLKRMVYRQTPALSGYLQVLRTDPKELQSLYGELLIGVTELFRDPEVFREVERLVLPTILDEDDATRTLRLWVPGCSSGDEVYSLAISFMEAFRRLGVQRKLQIFATDLNEMSLSRARCGRYPASVIEALPPAVQTYFVKLVEGYQIGRTVRELCIFARQDVTQDPPFSHLDMVSCRNLLIYLSVGLQRRALQHFHYALRPDGFLLLGSSESLGDCEALFSVANKRHKIFQKRAVPSPSPLNFSRPIASQSLVSTERAESIIPLEGREYDISKHADRLILARYSPPGVIVDENLDIVQFRGRTGAYLQPPVGAATHNILKMAREGLLAALKSCIDECLRTQSAVHRENVQVHHDTEDVRRLNLDIVPIRTVGAKGKFLLIMFQETYVGQGRPSDAQDSHQTGTVDLSVESEILYLRHELLATREYLSSIIADRESSNEELKAANEEAQSANEELQSANEELETAKEELQSTNEELATINEQVHERNFQLHRANSDLNNILSSVEMPVVILDSDFIIRRFTPSAQALLNVIPGDIGRPFYQVRTQIEVPNLESVVREVLGSLVSREIEQQSSDGRWFSVQIRPYRTVDNRIDGVVLGFVDINDLRANRMALDNAERAANRLLEIYPHPLALLSPKLTLIAANSRFQTSFPTVEGKAELPKIAAFDGGRGTNFPYYDSTIKETKLGELDGLGEDLMEIVQAYADYDKANSEQHEVHLPGKSSHPVHLRKVKLHTDWYLLLEVRVDEPSGVLVD